MMTEKEKVQAAEIKKKLEAANIPVPEATYTYKTQTMAIDFFENRYDKNLIDLKLNCQRGFVWDEAREQNLIDTLVHQEMIPEFHAIKEENESTYHFADGKQRTHTIIGFLKGDIPWKKKYAKKDCLPLFEEAKTNKLYFESLPDKWKNVIWSHNLNINIYNDMDEKKITELFQKLNAGKSLSAFAKVLANNITIKLHFLDEIMEHPMLPKLFSSSAIQGDSVQEALTFTMLLMKAFDENNKIEIPLDLRPSFLLENSTAGKYVPNISDESYTPQQALEWKNKLLYYKKIILEFLDYLYENRTKWDSRIIFNNYPPFVMSFYFSYTRNLSFKNFMILLDNSRAIKTADVVGNGADFSKNNVAKWMKFFEKNLL